MLEKRSYKGKNVFVGIDVHKDKYVVVCICEDVIAKKWTTVADPDKLAVQLNSYFKGAKEINSAYEAGFSGFTLHRILTEAKIKNYVVNPADIKTKANDRVKTDKRDAQKIAEQLAAKQLKCIYIPSEKEEQLRSLTRGREDAIKRRTSIGNKIKSKLHYLGISVNQRFSEKFLVKIEEFNLAYEHQFVLNELVNAYREVNSSIKRYDKQLALQACSDKNQKIYESAPGIGEVSARVLSNELGDMSRFGSMKKLSCYVGLTPGEYSSGEHTRKTRITKQGSSRLRAMLVEIAWRAITKDKKLRQFYNNILSRHGSKKAIVAVSRKILCQLRHCLLSQELWASI